MANYAKGIPIGNTNTGMTEFPAPFKAQARYVDENAAASSVITLTDNTTQIEVGTNLAGGAYLRWVPITETAAVTPFASVLTTNFDHYIAPGTVRSFVVPKETQGVNSVVGANIQNGLYRRVATIGAGAISSVITTEY